MGKVVQFSVKMKSRAQHEAEVHDPSAPLAIRLMPMSKRLIEECNAQGGSIPPSTTWAWALVRLRPGLPDVMIEGGPADSMTEAEDKARAAFRGLEETWAQRRAEGLVMS
jgi:hypothetical protein